MNTFVGYLTLLLVTFGYILWCDTSEYILLFALIVLLAFLGALAMTVLVFVWRFIARCFGKTIHVRYVSLFKRLFPWSWALVLAGIFWLVNAPAPPAPVAPSIVGFNLRILQAASLGYFEAHSDDLKPFSSNGRENLTFILPWIDDPRIAENISTSGNFAFCATPRVWWFGYRADRETADTRHQLENRATWATTLYGSNSLDAPPASDDAAHLYKRENPVVWMRVRLPDAASRDGAGE